MSPACDVLIVGSGPSGANAAVPLVEAGLSVTMLDVGMRDEEYAPLIPEAPFDEIRRTHGDQHRFFLGDRFEGIPLRSKNDDAAPQLGPPRRYVLEGADRLLPVRTSRFAAIQSAAQGGLGGAWGAGSFPFLDGELRRAGLDPDEMRPHYDVIARRVGISGEHGDDLAAFSGELSALQPALELDHNAEELLARYRRRRDRFRRAGVYMGHPLLAVLSRELGERRPNPYHDMDFWSNAGGSVYRPELTLQQLSRHENFRYRRGYLVRAFDEMGSAEVRVQARRIADGAIESFAAQRLILAAGALGTSRIALRSLGAQGVRVPLVCNAHSYTPCVRWRGIGRPPKERRHGLAQLTLIHDPTGDREHLVQAQLYSYRSLMLFRLLGDSSLPVRESLRILRALCSSFVICLIQHEDHPSAGKYCVLEPDGQGGDVLRINYDASEAETREQRGRERVIVEHLRQLGCRPLSSVQAVHGSSVHYAGQFPTTPEERPLTTEPSGRLRGTHAVYVADGAALAYLPAKGLTCTLMANANRVATRVASSLSARASAAAAPATG